MGRFVVFEGIDGSGKSTLVRALADRLDRPDVVLTEEPTKGWLGDAVRRSHVERLDPLAETFLFLADRAVHTAEIREWLSEGKLVLCDRYYHSTVAYQGAALEGRLDQDPVPWLLDVNRKISIEPDIVLFFKIDPEVALGRINSREELSKFERVEFLRKVSGNYDRLADMLENIVVVDASRPAEAVLDEIVSMLM